MGEYDGYMRIRVAVEWGCQLWIYYRYAKGETLLYRRPLTFVRIRG